MARKFFALLIAFSIFCGDMASFAAAQSEDLRFFEEEAKVITASRREQTIADSPLAADVVTSEEIKASGASNLWDLLRFRVGMDVVDARSIDGNRAAVSVRGFPQEFAQNLLVLVDGRSVYSPSSDGVYWDELPVQMQDIERIEIIRGPNAALYGTGAALGVVNIITKKSKSKTTLETDNRGGNLGMLQSSEALESSIGKMAYRASYTFRQQNGFPATSGGGAGNDSLHKNAFNFRTDVPLADRSNLELFAGGSWVNTGIASSRQGDHINQHFQMLKFSHQFSKRSIVEAMSSRSDNTASLGPRFDGSTQRTRFYQYDEDILHRLTWWNGHMYTAYGASHRYAKVDAPLQYPSSPWIEIYRGYFNQTVKPTEMFSLQGAVSLEHSNTAGYDPSYQVAAVITPQSRHAFRASYSVAHTLQDLFPLFADARISATTRFLGNADLESYKITSYETGYHGSYLDKHLQTDASLFYTHITNFHKGLVQSVTFAPFLVTLKFANYDEAIARGSELQLKYHFSRSRSVYANYTYEHITDTAGDLGLRTKNTPAHKVNFGGMADMGRGLSGSVNFGYKDNYFIDSEGRQSSIAVPMYWRMDARLAYAWPWYRDAELYVAGQNLLAPRHVEFADGLTVPRTYSGGISVKFGGNR